MYNTTIVLACVSRGGPAFTMRAANLEPRGARVDFLLFNRNKDEWRWHGDHDRLFLPALLPHDNTLHKQTNQEFTAARRQSRRLSPPPLRRLQHVGDGS